MLKINTMALKWIISFRTVPRSGLVHNLRFLSTAWPFVKDTYINDFKIIENSKKDDYIESIHAYHCMIYSKINEKRFTIQRPRGCVLMQMRFDGYLGFPGGLVDPGEDAIQGLNRELQEEMNLDLTKHKVTEKDFIFSQHSSSRNLTLHFYAIETTLPELEKIEARVQSAKDYGSEVLGTVRVPLYTMRDGFRGFPAFLTHSFIGSSKQQLLHTLQHLELMTAQEISDALSAKPPLES